MRCWMESCEAIPNVFCDCTEEGVLVCIDHLLDHMCVQGVEHKYEPLDVIHNIKARKLAEKQLVARIAELIRKKSELVENASKEIQEQALNLNQQAEEAGVAMNIQPENSQGESSA
ncbi:unnamed protein product [Blepharisma stoltei]|uniref:Uncharacterized protein n=1 Tax=Blepharisma stoltei TaxID=1481888 RepID=A0AAU9K8G4_9CILI|nr:unnamed protein product [Blepharisma stoltei]